MNMRMGEIEAALANNQISKLNRAITSRRKAADSLREYLKDLPGILPPKVMPGNDHVYYVFGMIFEPEVLGISREILVKALKAEGVPAISEGYQNIHKLPLFKNQKTYKNNPLPYSLLSKSRQEELKHMDLKVSEGLHEETFIGMNWCAKEYRPEDVRIIGEAFHKVWGNLEKLQNAFN